MNLKRFTLLSLWVFLLHPHPLVAQTVQSYELNEANIHVSPVPTPNAGRYQPTNYDTISKPLVAEPFSSNFQLDVDPSSIHASATGFASAFFGGDAPSNSPSSEIAVPIYTREVFDRSAFPITMETNFFNAQNVALYNESYFFLIPANYQEFGSPTFNINNQDLPKEGIVIGGRPFEGRVFNMQSVLEPSIIVAERSHTFAQNNEWYQAEVTLDVDGNNLIVSTFRINGSLVLENVIVGPIDWLDNFRLGIAVDDLASGWTIQRTVNQDTLIADFSLSDSLLCSGNCISIENLTRYSGSEAINYQWTFNGADQSSSTQTQIDQLCFNEPGTYIIRLSSMAGDLESNFAKEITILPLVELDLGVDSLDLCNGTSFTLDAFHPAADNYFWQDASSEPTFEVKTAGQYFVQVSNPCNNVRDSVFAFFSAPLTAPELLDSYSLCEVDSIEIDLSMSNATNYVWSDGDNSPIKTFNTIGAFQLLIANDCEERALNFLVEKSDCCNFYAPNAFSPNQDGQNDAFNIFFNPNGCDVITNFSLAIFDRWGGIVFETSEVDFKWDGKNRDRILLPGVYVWRMTYGDNQNPQIAFGELLLVK